MVLDTVAIIDNLAIKQVYTSLSTVAKTYSWQNMWRHAAEAADTFFSADGSISNDPLVIIAQRDACAACSFFKRVNRLSIVASVFVLSVCCMAFQLTQCECSRPLRWWLLVFSMLQLVQLPTRVVFLLKVLTAERHQASFQTTVASITTSPAWQLSKHVSLATYAWLILGIVWTLNSGTCSKCSSLYWLTITVLSQTALKTLLTLRIFTSSFPDRSIETDEATEMQAATQEQIAALPCVHHTNDLFSDDGMSCAVCLDDFAEGDCLRRLPCQHYFHGRCIDEWLSRSKRCPLCMGCIDAEK